MGWSGIGGTWSSWRVSYGGSVFFHMVSAPCVGQRPRDLAMTSGFEGAGIDLFVVPRVDVARVADGLRIFFRLLRQHRDLILGEAELVQRRDVEVLGQLINVLDAALGRLP